MPEWLSKLMGNSVSLEEELINLRLTSKQMQRASKKCDKNEKEAVKKLKKVCPIRAVWFYTYCWLCVMFGVCCLYVRISYTYVQIPWTGNSTRQFGGGKDLCTRCNKRKESSE